MAKVVTEENGTLLKGEYPGDESRVLSQDKAERLCEIANDRAQKLGLKVRYIVVD